jgi:hypothetical protein
MRFLAIVLSGLKPLVKTEFWAMATGVAYCEQQDC